MKLARRLFSMVLAALIAVPAPALAQTVRIALDAPLTGAPAFSAAVPFAPAAPSLTSPSLAPLSASFLPVLPAPSIAAGPIPTASGRGTPSPYGSVVAPTALTATFHPAPSAPDKPGEEQKAAADRTFDGSVTVEAAPSVSMPSNLDQSYAALGRVKAPRPWLEKGKVVLAYGGLTGAAVALNAPFEHMGPMIVGAVMAPMLSFFGLFFYSASQTAVDGAPLEGVEQEKPSAETMAMIVRLAAEAKVKAPARVKVLPGDGVNAQVGARDAAGYEIRFTKAFESLRPEVREAILRHEFAHQRHHDMPWQIAQIFIVTMAPMLALMSAMNPSALQNAAIAAIVAASVVLFPASMRRSEYLADQYAASKPEGAGPLARFFVEDDDRPARAATALSGRAFSGYSDWKRGAMLAWDWLKTSYKAHPSHDRRIARLVKLAEKNR
jgi:Zn-dependent protease with chaperone function